MKNQKINACMMKGIANILPTPEDFFKNEMPEKIATNIGRPAENGTIKLPRIVAGTFLGEIENGHPVNGTFTAYDGQAYDVMNGEVVTDENLTESVRNLIAYEGGGSDAVEKARNVVANFVTISREITVGA